MVYVLKGFSSWSSRFRILCIWNCLWTCVWCEISYQYIEVSMYLYFLYCMILWYSFESLMLHLLLSTYISVTAKPAYDEVFYLLCLPALSIGWLDIFSVVSVYITFCLLKLLYLTDLHMHLVLCTFLHNVL